MYIDMDIITLIVLFGVILVWYDSMKARERTLSMARQGCQEMSVQLLDDTVSLSYMGLKRDASGRLRIRRVYEFRYLDSMQVIQNGTIMLLGERPESFLMETDRSRH